MKHASFPSLMVAAPLMNMLKMGAKKLRWDEALEAMEEAFNQLKPAFTIYTVHTVIPCLLQ